MDYNNGQYNQRPNIPPTQGIPPQGMPPQGMPPQGMPPQGMPPQGMPPRVMPPMGPNPGGFIQDPGYYQWIQYQEQQNNKKANIMSAISVVLALLGAIGIPIINLTANPIFSSDWSSSQYATGMVATTSMILPYLGGLCCLVSLILMIVVRVKYPKNTFGKVLMWLYIVVYALYVIMVLVVVIFLVWFLSQCAGY